jgi:hypothetical protein
MTVMQRCVTGLPAPLTLRASKIHVETTTGPVKHVSASTVSKAGERLSRFEKAPQP